MNIFKVGEGFDTTPILLALARNPELWDQYKVRKEYEGTPHGDMSDIWVRYNSFDKFDGDLKKFNGPHFPVWYPAWFAMPELRPVVMGLFQRFSGTHLGGILITKIPPGKRIAPHTDNGWHAKFYNTKLYVVLSGNPRCWNRVLEEIVVMKTGEVWYFNNNVDHEIYNEGDTDRITLIVCMRND